MTPTFNDRWKLNALRLSCWHPSKLVEGADSLEKSYYMSSLNINGIKMLNKDDYDDPV